MAVSEANKVRARKHCGYLNVNESSTFVLGVPAAVQTQFVIEGALNRILPQAEDTFVDYLDKLDAIEAQISENAELLAVTKVDEIDIRENEFEKLLQRYRYWQGGLCNLLGVPPNPFDQRFGAGGGGGINVSVAN